MPRYDAFLLDVFDTVLSVDQERHLAGLAERAGVPVGELAAALDRWAPRVTDGRAGLAEAVAEVLGECGATADEQAVADLLAADRELIVDLAVLHPDTVPFLEELRAAGVRSAIVSNCAENARHLLDALGIAERVDELVLSCEVGMAKPDPGIFDVALDRLGVPADRAVLVDDKQDYCAAAASLGLASVRIDRHGGGDADIASFAELAGLST